MQQDRLQLSAFSLPDQTEAALPFMSSALSHQLRLCAMSFIGMSWVLISASPTFPSKYTLRLSQCFLLLYCQGNQFQCLNSNTLNSLAREEKLHDCLCKGLYTHYMTAEYSSADILTTNPVLYWSSGQLWI